MTNEELYDKALEAIRDLMGDTSVSVEECRQNLQGLIDEIEIMLSGLKE